MRDARAAVLLDAGGDPQLIDVQVRDPVDDEVLVRCGRHRHTDISVAGRWPARRTPMVFGHEGAGTVAAVGSQADVKVGQPVVLTFASCGPAERWPWSASAPQERHFRWGSSWAEA
jgi:aryl-alcohol dehydrogenase